MTPTQIARRSDALYADGTCGMTRRVLCDMVAQRESDLEDARAENAKLLELCATVIDDWMSKVCPSFPFCEYGGEYQDCTDETCGNQIYRQMESIQSLIDRLNDKYEEEQESYWQRFTALEKYMGQAQQQQSYFMQGGTY